MPNSVAYKNIVTTCLLAGFEDPKDVYKKSRLVFEDYRVALAYSEQNDKRIGTPEEIEAERRQLRFDLLDLFWRPFDEYKVQMKTLVDRAMATIWFEDLLDNATEMMQMYERGGTYKRILDNYYFHPNPKSKTKTERIYDCGFTNPSTFYDWHEEAVTLFGIEAWIHLKNNEYRDMAKGIIPYHDIFPDNIKKKFAVKKEVSEK